MQVMIDIPDEIPQEVVDKMLVQFKKQVQVAKNAVSRSLQADDGIKIKARQDLTQMVNKLRGAADELGFVSDEEISQWVTEARANFDYFEVNYVRC